MIDDIKTISRKNWQIAEPILADWKARLENYQSRNLSKIVALMSSFSDLFHCLCPTEINVDLHYHPRNDSSKGEPASGLAEAGFLPQKDSDVFYWLSKFSERPDDVGSLESNERMITAKIIHEDIHHDLQRDLFQSVLAEANTDPEVTSLRQTLMNDQAGYLEPEAEMTAIYLEQYAVHELTGKVGGENYTDHPLIHYRLDENRFHEITTAVVRADYSWKQDGPYTSLRRGWGFPDVPREVIALAHTETSGPNIYQLGANISDFSLFEAYQHNHKKLDLNFIKFLYRLFIDQKSKVVVTI